MTEGRDPPVCNTGAVNPFRNVCSTDIAARRKPTAPRTPKQLADSRKSRTAHGTSDSKVVKFSNPVSKKRVRSTKPLQNDAPMFDIAIPPPRGEHRHMNKEIKPMPQVTLETREQSLQVDLEHGFSSSIPVSVPQAPHISRQHHNHDQHSTFSAFNPISIYPNNAHFSSNAHQLPHCQPTLRYRAAIRAPCVPQKPSTLSSHDLFTDVDFQGLNAAAHRAESMFMPDYAHMYDTRTWPLYMLGTWPWPLDPPVQRNPRDMFDMVDKSSVPPEYTTQYPYEAQASPFVAMSDWINTDDDDVSAPSVHADEMHPGEVYPTEASFQVEGDINPLEAFYDTCPEFFNDHSAGYATSDLLNTMDGSGVSQTQSAGAEQIDEAFFQEWLEL